MRKPIVRLCVFGGVVSVAAALAYGLFWPDESPPDRPPPPPLAVSDGFRECFPYSWDATAPFAVGDLRNMNTDDTRFLFLLCYQADFPPVVKLDSEDDAQDPVYSGPTVEHGLMMDAYWVREKISVTDKGVTFSFEPHELSAPREVGADLSEYGVEICFLAAGERYI